MTSQQLSILNALVTYAAENVPGGLSEDEREVAKIVGVAALVGRDPMTTELTSPRSHNYKVINVTYHKSVAEAANTWADHGWRVVGVISDTRPGFAHSLILERPVGMSHPDD